MGKIKSARELAMERTGDMDMIKNMAQHKPGSEHEPYLRASSLLAGSFLDGETDLEKVSAAINRYPGGAREKAIAIFLRKVIAGMNLDNCKKVADAYRHYSPRGESGPVHAVEMLGSRFQNQVRKLHEGAEKGASGEQSLEHLHGEGIRGSALAGANLERSPWWEQQLADLAATFIPELESQKEQLLASLNSD